jgi:hypothetical protein
MASTYGVILSNLGVASKFGVVASTNGVVASTYGVVASKLGGSCQFSTPRLEYVVRTTPSLPKSAYDLREVPFGHKCGISA